MRRVLTTFGFGPHAALLDIALPTFGRYAAAHGYDLFVPSESWMSMAAGRAPSWLKIPLLRRLFEVGYEEVLWLDSDVVVKRFDKDIAAGCGGAPLHMVVHETGDGRVPNCGVWYVRRDADAILASAWYHNHARREPGWWEQSAIIAALGGDPDAEKVLVPTGPLWGELPYEWNPHVHDSRGVSTDCRFFHATMIHDRAVAMRKMRAEAT